MTYSDRQMKQQTKMYIGSRNSRPPVHPKSAPGRYHDKRKKGEGGTYMMNLQRNALLISLPIQPLEIQPKHAYQDDIQRRSGNARVHTWLVPRLRVLRPKHQTAGNAAQPAEAHERGAAKGALPLPAHVVCLQRHD